MNHGESVFSFIFACSFCILKRQLAWRNAWGKLRHWTKPCSARNSPYTIFDQPHRASRCSTHLFQWIFDKFGSWFSYKFHSPTPTYPQVLQQHLDQVRSHTHSSSSRRVKTAAVLQLNGDPLLSMWAIHSWAYVACTWAHVLKQIASVSLLQCPFIQTLQTVHLVFLPLQGESLSSVGAATESIKAYCVQLLPLVGGKLRHRRTFSSKVIQ